MDNNIYKKGLIVIGIIAVALMIFLGFKISQKDLDINNSSDSEEVSNITKESIEVDKVMQKKEDKIQNERIKVDIDGAVRCPGVYEFPADAIVDTAIKIAGGLTENADTKTINRARTMENGEKIYIPEKNEVIIDNLNNNEIQNIKSDKININTANKEQLMSLKGIGEVYSQRIIDYRKTNKFDTIEEIKEIKGIGEKTFEKIKDFIIVD